MIHQSKYTILFPTIGILIFIALYLYATSLYPGGSQANKNSMEFSWLHNYWCNLTSEISINGKLNSARPIAISAMAVLCTSLMIFFIQFSQTFTKQLIWKRIISLCGIVSMLSAMFIFTSYHDLMTSISSLFGLLVVIGILKDIYTQQNKTHKIIGIGAIILLAINNLIYYSGVYITYLPLIQKITFAYILLWIMRLNWKIYKSNRLARSKQSIA